MKEPWEKREISKEEKSTIFYTFLIATVLGGGAGIYFPLVMGKSINADSLATYIFAVLAPFWIDMLLPEPYWPRLLKKTKTFVGAGCTIAAVLAISALLRDGKSGDMTLAVLGTTVVLVIWIYLAALSKRYMPEPASKGKASLGGDYVSEESLEGGGLK